MIELLSKPYYAATTAPQELPQSEAESRLRKVLTDQAFDVVLEAVKRWNPPLREAVRAITALKFTDDSGRVAATAPIAVVDGMPQPLAEATSDIQPWQWWLVLHRPALKQADQGLNLVVAQRDMLGRYLGDISTKMGAVEMSRKFIAEILDHSIDKVLLERFGRIEEDVLGAYWMHASKIHIYWMPLAIFAPLVGVPLATLAVVVLCHELVHAYTHRGIDLNKASWRTDRFIATDTYVKEGLAQYYTEQIMYGLEARLPDGLTTFLAMTAKLSAPYTMYQDWLSDKKRPSPEATRLAMLEFRNATPPVYEHQSFVNMLHAAEAQIRGDRRKIEG